jgi:hypothetical protein
VAEGIDAGITDTIHAIASSSLWGGAVDAIGAGIGGISDHAITA